MKQILLTNITIMVLILTAFAEPGGTYILTGQEKNIEEIVKADMKKYPDLYKGKSFDFYVARFKKENSIGKHKLVPGDQLTFPQTKASAEAKAIAQQKLLVGKWSTNKLQESLNAINENFFNSHVIEYVEDGTCRGTLIVNHKDGSTSELGYSGKWKLEEGILKARITDAPPEPMDILISTGNLEHEEIIKVSQTELTTKFKKRDHTISATRVK